MSNTIVHQLNEELLKLKNELAEFNSTVEYLKGAKKSVEQSIQSSDQSKALFSQKAEELKQSYDAFQKLSERVSIMLSVIETINFPERLDSIESTIQDTIEVLEQTKRETIDKVSEASDKIVQADFDKKFENLESVINQSVNSNQELAVTIVELKLSEKIEELEKGFSEKLNQSIQQLETNTKKISDEISNNIRDLNLPIRFDKLDANISVILNSVQNVQSRIDSLERNIVDKLKDISEKQTSAIKKQQTNNYVTWALILISMVVVLVVFSI